MSADPCKDFKYVSLTREAFLKLWTSKRMDQRFAVESLIEGGWDNLVDAETMTIYICQEKAVKA